MGVGLRSPLVSLLVIAVILAGAPLSARAKAPAKKNPQITDSTVITTDSAALSESLDRLFAGSAAWRDALDAVNRTGRRIYVVTPERIRMIDPRTGRPRSFDTDTLAEVIPLPNDDLRVDVVVVVVNVWLLERMHREQGLIVELEGDLDRILAHEVFGHAVPYLIAGHMSGRCPDPLPDQQAVESCAIQRENRVRAEMGFGHRTEYGLDGLALVRAARYRQAVR